MPEYYFPPCQDILDAVFAAMQAGQTIRQIQISYGLPLHHIVYVAQLNGYELHTDQTFGP